MSGDQITESCVSLEMGTEAHPVLIRSWAGAASESVPTATAYALRTTDGWIFIDPVRPVAAGVDRLRRLIRARPVATVLTSDGHERFCYGVREQWGTPVWGPVLGEAQRDPAYDGRPDYLYGEADTLPGGLRAIKLAGAWRGDHALLWQAPSGERVLFSGDILNGQVEPGLVSEDHYRRAPGLYFGARPEYVERHADPGALRASLTRLLREEFDLVCGAHARPFRDKPKTALTQLIKTI